MATGSSRPFRGARVTSTSRHVGEAERGSALWVRPLGSLEARVVLGTEGVSETSYPFWSVDGAQIAYRTARALERVNVTGGLTNTIVDGVSFYRHLLYKATNVDWRKGAIYVGSLDPEERPLRLLEASRALYVEPGYIVYSQESALYARKFDAARLEFTGPPAQIADDVFYRDSIDTSAFDAAGPTLIYRAVAKDEPPLPLLWVDRDGATTTAASPPLAPRNFRLSPDARKILYDEGSPPDVWILDLERGARTRVTSNPQAERGALWSPDGRSIVFDAHREGGRAIYEKRADSALPEKLLLAAGAHNVAVTDWSDDGRFIIFEQDSCPGCDMDIWVLPTSAWRSQRNRPSRSARRFASRKRPRPFSGTSLATVSGCCGPPASPSAPKGPSRSP